MTRLAQVLLFGAIVVLLPSLLLTSKSPRCPENWFDCGNGKCVAPLFRCDGENDCRNFKDEENCESLGLPPKACSRSQFQCVADRHCIPETWRCDGEYDCDDYSDEFNCDVAPTHISCSDEVLCSQKCTNSSESYSCSCVDGYELVNNTCRALGPEPLLVYGTLSEIQGIYLRSEKRILIRKDISNANAVTVDPVSSRLYWATVSNKSSVYFSEIDGHSFGAVLTNGLMEVEAIAVDYVAKNLYITDSGLRQILACKMDGSMCHVLHQTNITKPRGLALNLAEGFMYWSDWGEDNVGIYRSGMDGSNRITMVSDNIKWPNGIAIDLITKRLYWVDAKLKTIEYVTLDGIVRKVILKKESYEMFHPYALALFEDNLYWSDWATFSVEAFNKFTNRTTKVVKNDHGKFIMGVYVHHPVLSINVNNPCLSHSCSHMCLIAPMGNYSCVCPSGFNLSDDGRTCTIDDDFPMLLVNDDTSIYRIRPGAVGNDVAEELSINQFGLIGKLAYDWNTKTLFVSDKHLPAIYAINTTNMAKSELVEDHLVSPEDLAFDVTSGNLYWIDSGKGSVEVISTITFNSSVIIQDLSKPMSIALVPSIGRMFISTIGENPSISMYDMNGLNGKLMIACKSNTLAVHPSQSLLYWADPETQTVNSIDYSKLTSAPVVIRRKVGHVISLAVNENNVYWTDSRQNDLTILRHNTSHIHIVSLPKPKSGLASRKVIYASPMFRSSGDMRSSGQKSEVLIEK